MLKSIIVVCGMLGLVAVAKPSDASPSSDQAMRPEVTTSFYQSCKNTNVEFHDGAITFAEADSCQKRDGSWGDHTEWAGRCTGDVSNNDGNIVCVN